MNDTANMRDAVYGPVRQIMRGLARGIDTISGGRVTPNMVTILSLVGHLAIASLIIQHRFVPAALLLIIFGLFDALDGELARLQKKATAKGMFLDSVSDKTKEVLLYIGIGYSLNLGERPDMAFWAVAALGTSLLVSYTNAWGEAVMADHRNHDHTINKAFRSGLMSFEIRMLVVIIGLLMDRLLEAVVIIAVLSGLTALQRFMNIYRRL